MSRHNSGFSQIVVVVIIGLVIAGGGATLLYNNQKPVRPTESTTEVPLAIIPHVSSSTPEQPTEQKIQISKKAPQKTASPEVKKIPQETVSKIEQKNEQKV